MRRYWLIALLALGVALSLRAQPVRAATFTVTSLDDTGTGTLRDAVWESYLSPDDDVIDFSVTGTINLLSTIIIYHSGTLTINAAGVTLDGNLGAGILLLNSSGAAGVTINDITLTQGHAVGSYGGAIYNQGNLTLNDCVIFDNYADNGGGAIYSDGFLTIDNCAFSDNHASGTAGGAIYNTFGLNITNSSFSDHTAFGPGGAIYLAGTSDVNISGTTFTNNTAPDGGAISMGAGTLDIDTSVFTGNTATDEGGAVHHGAGALTILSSRFDLNAATTGGAIAFAAAGTRGVTGSCINLNDDTAVTFVGGGGGIATGNWWGSAAGPYTGASSPAPNDGNTVGSYGDSVTLSTDPAEIDYSGYLTTAPSGCRACTTASALGGAGRDSRLCPVVP